MVCDRYFIVLFSSIFLKKFFRGGVENKADFFISKKPAAGYIIALSAVILFNFVHIQLVYFLQFFTGYYAGKWYKKEKEKKYWVMLLVLSAVAGGARIFLKQYIDGSVFYNEVVAPESFNIISIWMILTVSMILNKFSDITKRVAESGIWKHLEDLSYYIYISHYIFLVGPYAVDNYIKREVFRTPTFIVFSVLLAEVLRWIQNKIINRYVIKA